jgi:hypothetical protein
MAKGPDTQGGSREAVQPKDLSKGEQAEKGDAHREYRQHTGKTRGRTLHDERSGSDSGGGSKKEGKNQ